MAQADVGHQTIREHLRPGITELELFGEVLRAMMAGGSELPALIPIFNAVPVREGRPVWLGHSMAGRKVVHRLIRPSGLCRAATPFAKITRPRHKALLDAGTGFLEQRISPGC